MKVMNEFYFHRNDTKPPQNVNVRRACIGEREEGGWFTSININGKMRIYVQVLRWNVLYVKRIVARARRPLHANEFKTICGGFHFVSKYFLILPPKLPLKRFRCHRISDYGPPNPDEHDLTRLCAHCGMRALVNCEWSEYAWMIAFQPHTLTLPSPLSTLINHLNYLIYFFGNVIVVFVAIAIVVVRMNWNVHFILELEILE